MVLNPARLMAFPIPEIRQRVSSQDVVFYALSVGLGQDPMDLRQLDYVDAHRELRAMPSIAVVLGHPGFWLGDERTGVDALRLVHGEQTVELHRPLSIGSEVVGRTRITGLVDKGVGRGALLFTEKHITDADSGTLLAVTKATTFLRGDGGCGGTTGAAPKPHPMPDTPPDLVVSLETRPEQALYYRLNGDDNPLHADPAVAARAGFPRPILHGLCTFGVVTHALLRGLAGYAPAALREISLRFSTPVYPGEPITTEIWRDGSFRARVVERDVIVVDHGRAVMGEAA